MRGAAVVVAGLAVACGAKPEPVETPTFTRDVAPIVFSKCSPCHTPQGAGPFPLLSYSDVKRRASQIAQVTSDRFMPPWLPEPGLVDFANDRSLSSSQIELIARWVEAGSQEGDPEALPPLTEWYAGWELGAPDLVVEMNDAYELPPEGRDVFRSFVVPIPTEVAHYVRAFEFRPGNPRAVHHAALLIDETGSSRELDDEDDTVGFDSMVVGSDAVMPDGHFLGWTPGKRAYETEPGMSWTLPAGADLVLQLHMPTTGRVEKVQASVGLYFTDEPPRRAPFVIRLGSRTIDILPGVSAYRVQDEYRLPIAVTARSIYPHAHYLAREMEVKATLPDGRETWLLHIPEWDFNWQDIYRYREPISLPAGSVVSMKYVYDDSEANPRNPSRPPRRVRYGPQSTDEMGDVYLELLPERPELLDRLAEDFVKKDRLTEIRELRLRVEESPGDGEALNRLGVIYDSLGMGDEALQLLRDAVRAEPALAVARFNLGTLLVSRGLPREGVPHLRQAVTLQPRNAEAHVRLGNALRDLGELAEAERELRRALELRPAHGWGRYSLALALQIRGKLDEALVEYARALPLRPTDPELRVSYGAALAGAGRVPEAMAQLEEAVRLDPDWPEPSRRLEELRAP